MTKKIPLTYIALVIAQLACSSVYAQTSVPNGCTPAKDGNSFMSPLAQTIVNSEGQTKELATQYANAFKATGLTLMQSVGIVANLMLESGLNSGIWQGGRIGELRWGDADVINQTGYGLAQWGEARRDALLRTAEEYGLPTSSQCVNLNYLMKELLGDEKETITALRKTTTLEEAVTSFEATFERASEPNLQSRIDNAKKIMGWLCGNNMATCDNDAGSSNQTTPSGGDTAANVGGARKLSADDIAFLNGLNKGNSEYDALNLKPGDTMPIQDFNNWADVTNDGSRSSSYTPTDTEIKAGHESYKPGTSNSGTCGSPNGCASTDNTPSGDTPSGDTLGGDSTGFSSPRKIPGTPGQLSMKIPAAYEQYRVAINAAARATGIDANRIAAVIWAESRNNLNNPESSTNSDGTTDWGLMQIGQERYDRDIKKAVGGQNLNVRNSTDNIMAGSLELLNTYNNSGKNWDATHRAYVGHNNSDDAQYAAAVEGYYRSLNSGNSLKDGDGF